MAHIADFMVDADISTNAGLNNYMARELSTPPPQEAAPEVPASEEKEKHVWRMHQPAESRKLHLFPSREKLSIAAGRRSPDAETTTNSTPAMGQNGSGEKDRSILGAALRLKSKEPVLNRRRKVSVAELGPMTTVQEIAMDSPTIPGRPPAHERSISAPGNSWRQHMFGESMLSCITGPALDENAEIPAPERGVTPVQANYSNTAAQPSPPQLLSQSQPHKDDSASPRGALSPKSLAPLVIPSTSAPTPQYLTRRPSKSRLRSESTPPDVPPKSARMKEGSPFYRTSPFTPGSEATRSASTLPLFPSTTPTSALTSTAASALISTPASTLTSSPASALTSAPASAPERQSSPKPWTTVSAGASPMGHTRGHSETPQLRSARMLGHRRGESETSIMDRGRPKKRADGSPMKRTASKRSASQEQKAFERLPRGTRATEASSTLPASEIDVLRKQAIGQASRFEVLNAKHVEVLSRELRGLDERCEYLRKTHRSLRSGRRNLHDRICTYLRSPRVARFSHESMLKQEEALSELDSSIDDWVSKLEQAENRRTRVRQKLLEHVAAALIMDPATQAHGLISSAPSGENTPPRSPTKTQSPQRGEDTPPRSPTKTHSPQRLAEEVKVSSPESISSKRRTRASGESIRIYADSDVYALLADVEEEINRMGDQAESDRAAIQQQQEADRAERQNAVMAAGITLNAVAFEGIPNTRAMRRTEFA